MAKVLTAVAILLSVATGHVSANDGTDDTTVVENPQGGAVATPDAYVEPTPVPETEAPYGIWDRLAECEAGGDWSANTGNGFYGGLQHTLSTWRSHGGIGMPNQASRSEQIMVAQRVQADQGWAAWPACSYRLGLR